MAAPSIDNKTNDRADFLFLYDETGNPLLTVVVKATFILGDDSVLRPADPQDPVNFAGEYWGDPETSGYKVEPETAFFKPATDVVLIGHAHAPAGGVKKMGVDFRVGPMRKSLIVFGDRYWFKSLGKISMSSPKRFEKIPLIFENAFGGKDTSDPDLKNHVFDDRNPIGTGFCKKGSQHADALRVPNIEYRDQLITHIGDHPPPAATGFVSPHWRPRASFAGTYDAKWMKERMPFLPSDFNRRFFNAAPADQVVGGYLKGSEQVLILNAWPGGKAGFYLPGLPPPQCIVERKALQDTVLSTVLDTVMINSDEKKVHLIWRTTMVLAKNHDEVVTVAIDRNT